MKTLSPRLLEMDAARAAVAKLWIEGETQKRIGYAFARKAGTINRVICQFIVKYYPDYPRSDFDTGPKMADGQKRIPLARIAVQRYLSQRFGR